MNRWSHNVQSLLLFVVLLLLVGQITVGISFGQSEETAEAKFLTNMRQLTFDGRRAGEGYFSQDGSLMVFQSERRDDNPFYQIYLLDFETGEVELISPGHGKTTCAWVHPDNDRILFASTQNDPEARAKQKQEIEFRESGQEKRYSWDYDPTYELYAFDRTDKTYTQLTHAKGYDAEGSYSPDGQLIAFASNRNAYAESLSDEARKKFDTDPAHAMEIFIMNADGSKVRQLTDVPGYDGGPFFSPDGNRICWRRFSENGVIAEIFSMNIDGTDQRQLTKMGAMSWAPFYHPSGKYLVFTTNKHGFGNFELYLVDVDGKSEPVRVTHTDGFDGLASFTPDGKQLTWTSNRNEKKQSQIYVADWNLQAALGSLSMSWKNQTAVEEVIGSTTSAFIDDQDAANAGTESAKIADSDFDPRDIMRHVDYLCRKELAGRMTGSEGERKATSYVAAYLDYLGLKPAGDNGSWFQKFEFPDGTEIGPDNRLTYGGTATNDGKYELETDWRPLTFSGNVVVEPKPVVFAGYGIVAPEQGDQAVYDSYTGLDVTDKWVLVFRFVPEDVSPERRQHLNFYGSLRKKAFYAREKGAAGLIVVSGPSSLVKNQLVPLQSDFSPAGSSMAAISVTDAMVEKWLHAMDENLATLQRKFDSGNQIIGFEISDLHVGATLDIKKITGTGRNVVGRLQAGPEPSQTALIVGAHIDHLGLGKTGGSLAKESEQESIHFGADDNASGVAGMLEIAEYLVAQRRAGKLQLKHDVIFAGWSGEELGLHGSKHFVDELTEKETVEPGKDGVKPPTGFHEFRIVVNQDGSFSVNGEPQKMSDLEKDFSFIGQNAPDFQLELVSNPKAPWEPVAEIIELAQTHGIKKLVASIQPPKTTIIAALNMDMIGRLEDKLILQGISSSDAWTGLIESKNAVVGLPLTLSGDTDLPTDASSFYQAGIPILSAFTGSHTDYHTPRDTPEKLNYQEAARIAKLMGLITRSLATSDEAPNYLRQKSKPKEIPRGGLRAYLGSVPSYGDEVVGVKLSDVTSGAPADLAGVKAGDIIVGLAGKTIENIYDYTAVIDALKVGQEVKIIVEREGNRIELLIKPGSRQ